MKAGLATTVKKEPKKSQTYIKYEKLLLALEKQQAFQENLRDGLQKAFTKINNVLAPLQKENNVLLRSYIIRIDELATEIGVGKFNKQWLDGFMEDNLESLLEYFGFDDEVLAALYKKYAGRAVDEIGSGDDVAEIARSLSEMLGFEVDADELVKKGETAWFDAHRDEILDSIKNRKPDFEEEGTEQPNPGQQKPKKINKEDVQLAKDARNIYMQLMKKYHPDLETNPELREQKTEIVKQITKAYQEKDFFTLLKLRLTYLEDNEAEADVLAEDLLKRYNKILKKQLDELIHQITDTHYSAGGVIADFIDKNGKFSPQKFAARRKALIKENTFRINELTESAKKPKGWFKQQIANIKQYAQQQMMEDMFADMFSNEHF